MTSNGGGEAAERGARAPRRAPIPFRTWRWIAYAAQAAVILGLPFVRVGGESALRLDVPSGRLHAFGAALAVDEAFVVNNDLVVESTAQLGVSGADDTHLEVRGNLYYLGLTGGSNIGNLIVSDMQFGEYTLAVWDTQVGTQEIKTERLKPVYVYPNPSNDVFFIQYMIPGTGEVYVLTSSGASVKRMGRAG